MRKFTLFTTNEQMIKTSFARVKEELSEHLDAINANTNEIQANHEYMSELENKIDKLSEKIDQICMVLQIQKEQEEVTVDPLTLREQEVFIALYTTSVGKHLSYQDISHKIGLPQDMVKQLVASLIGKGVPVFKHTSEEGVSLELDTHFRELQAKKNILQLNEQLVSHMLYEN